MYGTVVQVCQSQEQFNLWELSMVVRMVHVSPCNSHERSMAL